VNIVRVLLVNLPRDPRELMFPLELASVGAVLKSEGHRLEGFDFAVNRSTAWPAAARRCDVLVWMPIPDVWPRVRRLLGELPAGDRRMVVLAGPQATLFPQEVLATPAVDAVILGEAEQVIGRAIQAWRDRLAADLPGVAWRDSRLGRGPGDIPPAERIERLDELPPADRTVFGIDEYTGMATRRLRYTQIVAGRGWGRDCSHSARSRLLGGGRRARSVQNVVDEMAALRDRFEIDEFHFEDDALFEDHEYVAELCRVIRRELPGVVWQCPNGNHPDDVPIDLLAELAAAGCYRIYIEPHSPRGDAMELLDWPWDPKRIGPLTDRASQLGIELGGYFTLGLPDESNRQMQQTVDFAIESGLSWAQFTPFRFIPGSELWRRRDKLAPRLPDAEAVRRTIRRAYRRFYGSPRRCRAVLRNINRRNAAQILRRAYDKLILGQPF